MSAHATNLRLHRAALDAALRIVERVQPEQLGLPTPCADWDVRALLQHMIAGTAMVAPVLDGAPFGSGMDVDQVGTDPAAAYRAAADAAQAAFEAPDVATRTIVHPVSGPVAASDWLLMRYTDQAAHSWDLATALGMAPGLPDELCQAAIEFTARRFECGARPAAIMAEPQAVADDAPPADRMAAFLGRRVPVR